MNNLNYLGLYGSFLYVATNDDSKGVNVSCTSSYAL